jgi:methylated-DNA-[protein]-cysteine S-methyltransferase
MTTVARLHPSPVGTLRLTARDGRLVGLHMDAGGPDHDGPDPDGEAPDPVLDVAAAQLDEWFAGTRREFDLDAMPMELDGTPFQREVWTALMGIPFGETISYGELARRVGRPPAASRAVGAANGRNPISIIVPCHRVIGADGTLVGYGGGLECKRWLLDWEQGRLSLPLGG